MSRDVEARTGWSWRGSAGGGGGGARIARTTYDSSDLVVEYAMSAMRPGYPIETIMERKPAPDGLA